MTTALDDPFADGLPVLAGEGILLRRFEERDAPEVFRLYEDRDAVRFGYAPKMDDLADARTVIALTHELAQARTLYHWGVADAGDGSIVGHATLFHLEPSHRRAEIGYSVRRDRWGRGIGTRAVAVLVRFAFERLALRRLEADVDPRNGASLRLLEKLGFQREGLLRERCETPDEVQDSVMFGLLRREWAER